MYKDYQITGMTCNSCVAKVKKSLESIVGVQEANIQLDAPQARLHLNRAMDIGVLQQAIGHYQIQEIEVKPQQLMTHNELPDRSLATYKPLLLIIGFTVGISFLVQFPFTEFSGMLWMRHFMAGFFIVFAFFKLLNIEGFASSYRMYDIIAQRWKAWGLVYPFVELGLGIAYLINAAPFWTNLVTVVVLGISSIGVIKSNLDKRKIKCACLGDVFNLPMSTVTIIEDLSMVAMAGWMLLSML